MGQVYDNRDGDGARIYISASMGFAKRLVEEADRRSETIDQYVVLACLSRMDAFAANDKAEREAQALQQAEQAEEEARAHLQAASNELWASNAEAWKLDSKQEEKTAEEQSAINAHNFPWTDTDRRITEYNTLRAQGSKTIEAATMALMTAIRAMIGLEVNERIQRLGQEMIDKEIEEQSRSHSKKEK